MDFTIRDEGSVFMFTPLTGICRQWIEEHIQPEGWQWLGNSFAVEHRYAQSIRAALLDAGFNGEYN
jgi:hypothetical protein